jgi:hypothetical protein
MGNTSLVRMTVTALTRGECLAATIDELFDGDDACGAVGGCDANADGCITAADLTASAGG